MFKEFFKKGQRLFASLLSVALMLSVIPTGVIAFTGETVNENGYIEVDSVEDLYLISYDLTANYILVADIDMTSATSSGGDWDFGGRGWSPIGGNNIYSNGAFSGIFDGNGHKISGMRIDVTDLPTDVSGGLYIGLFANVSGTIKNLTVSGSIKTNHADNTLTSYVGAISGYCSGTIDNCHNEVIISTESPNQSSYVGGIVGYVNQGTIKNSTNRIEITGRGSLEDYSNSRYAAVGGISGYLNNGIVEMCYNQGSITSVCGDYSSKSWPNYNGADYYYVNAYSGGIVGYSNGGTIANSYNAAKISSVYDNVKNTGTTYSSGISNGTTVEIKACYNVEDISKKGTGNSYAIGAGIISDCYYLQGTGTQSAGTTSLTKGQMLLDYIYNGFDFENIWSLNKNGFYQYPQLINNSQDDRIVKNVILTAPTKTLYYLYEDLDLNGATITFEFENAEKEIIAVTEDMVTGFDSNKLGKQEITVKCQHREMNFTVTVLDLPYQEIKTIEDLYNIRKNLNGNYILMNNLDLTEATANGGDWDFDGRGWNPIGSDDVYGSSEFSGIFDGNGYYIKGMRIDATNLPSGTGSTTYVGLFANVTGEVRNLEMRDAIISEGCSYTGAIAGYSSGNIVNCAVSGTINGNDFVGGITGYSKGTIKKSYNTATVRGFGTTGGLVGSNYGTIENCYNTGNVSSYGTYKETSGYYTSTYGYYVAGIAGKNSGAILNCYNTGTISGYNEKYAFAISQLYNGANTNCYYIAETGTGSTGAISLTDAQLRLESMVPGFDFENVWTLNPYANHPYPQLISNIQDMNESVEVIRIISTPEKKEYFTGDKIDLTDGVFEAVYISGKSEFINITEDMITGFDSSVVGEQTITVTYYGKIATFEINVSQRPNVIGIDIISEPNRKEFFVGEDLDFAGAQVKIFYEDNTSAVQDITADMTVGATTNVLGEQTVNVVLYGFTDSFTIVVSELSIVSLEINTLPDKLVYLEGEAFDMTGLTLLVKFNNGRVVVVTNGYALSGYSAQAGLHIVTVKYLKLTTSFEVEVTARKVVSLELRQAPEKTEYYEGDEFDRSGIVLVALFDNNELEIIEDYEINGYDGSAGFKTISLSYGGFEVSFIVQVHVRSITNFYIDQYPVKTNYIENEALDTTGLVVKATYNDGNTKTITDYKVVGFSSLPGVHTLHITFEGQVASFEINVSAKVLSDVRIVLPNKTEYLIGEEFDITGMQVIACYNNGHEYIVDGYTMTGFDSSSAGAKEIVITYGEFTRSFAVVVTKKIAVQTDGAIKVGVLKGCLGETIGVPVIITQNPGLAAFCHTITFDPTALKFVSVTANNGFSNGTIVLNDEKAANGEITVLWYQPTDVVESGVAYTINFEIRETATDGVSEISIAFDDNDNGNASGEDVIFETVSGSVEVLSYWLGDLDGDRKYTMVDIVQLSQYVSGKQMTLTDKQKMSADVNEDGIIDIHDVTLLSQWLLEADF